MRAMIVEDEPASAEYIAAICKRFAPNVVLCAQAENGEEALARMESARPDIVITDIAMPRMDGLSLTAELSRRYPNVSVILISGYQQFEYARTALRYGAVDYLLKPVNPKELVRCLNTIAARRTQANANAPQPHVSSFTPLQHYVDAHLCETLTLPALCKACNVSQTTANRLFRKHTGQSFLEYLTGKRIEKACALLDANPSIYVKTVAISCGFSDPLYFSKVFKAMVGCSPSEFALRRESKE